MGSLCNSSNTTTSTYTPNPQASQYYNQVISQAEQVASTPYQAYTGQLVAPVNAQQTQGINAINTNANYAQPYIGQAAGYATAAASPLSSAQIAQYQNPYTQSVVNATQAQFNNSNAQQQQQLTGNAIQNGAFGGDRAKIAGAILAGQQQLAQAPVIAGLESQGYTQGVQTAEQQQQNQANAAYSLGNLGVAGQGAALSGAGAQIGAGTLQQQTQQAQDTAALQQYYQALAFPYQQTQFLAGVGQGAAQGLGGTQTTQGPTPSLFSQLTGAELAGIGVLGGTGAFGSNGYLNPSSASSIFGSSSSIMPELALAAARGGRINAIGGYADGGSTPYAAQFNLANAGGIGWIPSVPIRMGQSPHLSAPSQSSNVNSPMASISGGLQALKTAWPGAFNRGNSSPLNAQSVPQASTPMFDSGVDGGTGLPGYGGLYARGGVIDMMHHMRKGLRARHYDDGGTVSPAARIANAFSIVPSSPAVDPAAYNLLQDYGTTQPDAQSGLFAEPMPTTSPLASAVAAGGAGPITLPPEILTGQSNPVAAPIADTTSPLGISPLAYSGDGNNATPAAPLSSLAPEDTTQAASGNFADRFFTPANSTSLIAAGLGMMAGTSPFGLANIGAGGLKGLEQAQELRKEQLTKDQMAQQAELKGRELAQQLLMHREITPYQQAEININQERQKFAEMQPVVIGQDVLGRNIYAVKDPASGQYKPINPAGTTMQPGQPPAAAPANGQATGDNAAGIPRIGPLPAQAESAAQMIANYQLPPLSAFAMKTPYGQAVMGRVHELNGDYNATYYNEANQTRVAFAKGPQGDAVRSFGVGISHLNVLGDAVDALQNGDIRKFNALRQYFQTELGLSTAPTTVDAIKPIVSAEITKAIVGAHMGEGDRKDIQAGLSKDLATGNIKDVIDKYQQLMGGQLVGYQRQYLAGTHGAKDFEQKLSPAAVAMLHRAEAAEQARITGAGAPPVRSPQDQQALDWATANPTDPRAAKIKQRLGVQ